MLTDTPIGLSSWRHAAYALSYRSGESNSCPGCGRQNWIVGRLMAECAFCGTALTLMHVHGYGSHQRVWQHGPVDVPPPPEVRAVI